MSQSAHAHPFIQNVLGPIYGTGIGICVLKVFGGKENFKSKKYHFLVIFFTIQYPRINEIKPQTSERKSDICIVININATNETIIETIPIIRKNKPADMKYILVMPFISLGSKSVDDISTTCV